MKKFYLLTLLIVSLFVTSFSQTRKTIDNKQNIIEYDISKIANIDKRVYFINSLYNDARFILTLGEETGSFLISLSDEYEDLDLNESFKSFFEEISNTFNQLTKEEAGELFNDFKQELPEEYMNQIMLDIYIKSRTNNLCANADPFCTDNGMYTFPAGVNAGNGEPGPNYDCLRTTPNPAWYYMKIGAPGNIDI